MFASFVVACLLVLPQDASANAEKAYAAGDYKTAYLSAELAAKADPNRPRPWELMALAARQLKQHADAVAAFTKLIPLVEKDPRHYDRRGDAYLMHGKFREAVADFDEAIRLEPKLTAEHWRRGIALYYLGKHADGVKQFTIHKQANPQDVENAAWHYLCNVRVAGKTEAVKQLIVVTKDPRPALVEIQKLYAGTLQPEAVLAAADKVKADTNEGRDARFYAHLYVGLWYESEGNAAKAKEHITIAADKYPNNDYMWDIAKMHATLLNAKK